MYPFPISLERASPFNPSAHSMILIFNLFLNLSVFNKFLSLWRKGYDFL